MDQGLYKRYLRDLKHYLVDIIGVESSPMLGILLERHNSSSIIFLVSFLVFIL